jgi:hypothetical protein
MYFHPYIPSIQSIMDILYVYIFLVVNLLPAGTKECQVYADNRPEPVFMLKLNAKKEWECKLNTPETNTTRNFKVTAKTIAEASTSGESIKHDIAPHIDLAKIKWKTVQSLKMKEPQANIVIKREKKSVQLIKDGETSNPMTIKF